MAKKIIYDFSTNKEVMRDLTNDEIKTRTAENSNKEANLAHLRLQRNILLAETDWWALSDLTITDAQKKYRQDLRDITKTYQSLSDKDFKFPTKPME
tara:strand:+ start:631 stop:921 length:291 start_codon:yes stop_codon:yes gene_type:complete